MKNLLFAILLISATACATPQKYQITFKVDLSEAEEIEKVVLMGNVAPLSWDKEYLLEDNDGDKIYEATIEFKTKKKYLEYKFKNGKTWEFDGSDNRIQWFKAEPQVAEKVFNEYGFYSIETLDKLRYTPAQIKEDVNTLRKVITYTHPNLYKYRDSALLEQDFRDLEAAMLADPSLVNAYKAVSSFATKIKCSHTFTNPWNQGPDVKKAIFFQPDKVPFTFSRIGKRIFIDKNTSSNEMLESGIEVLSINGVKTEDILTQLVEYVTSDGDNYEKRLQRLTLTGMNKFELFDIFFPLEYGSQKEFKLALKNNLTDEFFEAVVPAVSKTERDKILKEKYNVSNKIEDGWAFDILEEEVAYLKMQTFAIYNDQFDWKGFLDRSFGEIQSKNIDNLIIDIRGNEGGRDEIYGYILQQILTEPISIPASSSYVNYKKIPEDLKPHISTWNKLPYNWGANVEKASNGQYRMKGKFSDKATSYKPKSNGFKGKTYLLIDAENSSATHIMATYAKQFGLATLVGQATGGNQRGLNGGNYFFHRLPNSRVEIDIPLIGIELTTVSPATPNGGVQPDILIEKSVDDFIKGIDTELQATLNHIKSLKN